MRLVLCLLLLVHGGLHLLGFLKPWKLAELSQMSGKSWLPLTPEMARGVGLLWLLSALVLIAAAALRWVDSEWFGALALVGVLLSEALIVLFWHDAKAGTLPNAVLLPLALATVATTHFKQDVRRESRALFAGVTAPVQIVKGEELMRLPPPVEAWLEASGVVGKERARSVRLHQRGAMRTSPEGAWMPARAEQVFSVEPPAFVWNVDVTMFRLLPVVGRDMYMSGKGRMLIKAAGLVTIVDGSGATIDQGTLLRFLGEIVWFPSAALSSYIRWDALDERRARATMSYRGVSASAVFEFDPQGRFASLTAKRFMGADKGAALEDWAVRATAWQAMHGVVVPVEGVVSWRLKAGEFDYYRWQILDVEFNPAEAIAGRPPALEPSLALRF